MMSTGTPAAGLPSGSSTRPVTVIRPGAGVVGFVAGRGRLARLIACEFATWPAGFFIGLVLHREGVSQVARAGGDGAEEQQGQRDEFQLVEQHGSQHLLGKGRRRGREGPGGGLSGREVDRGPGGDVAQGG